MELPKNYTQIGEVNRYCRVYLEDYVISYIKQLNGHALDKEIAIGLFGTRKEEEGISYLFLYGACQLNFLQKATRHLSQAVLQEAERTRRKYFQEYEFLGVQVLNGDRLEGVHVYEQGTCRYIEGYAHFYEKNDSMLQFMLEERKEGTPEEVNREKYEEVKRRQEERRQLEERRRNQRRTYIFRKRSNAELVAASQNTELHQMKTTVAAVFVLLGLAGIITMGGRDKLDKLQEAARQMLDEMSEKQLPDIAEANTNQVQVGTVVAEDKLTDAILDENEVKSAETKESEGGEPDASVVKEESPEGSSPEDSNIKDGNRTEESRAVDNNSTEDSSLAEQGSVENQDNIEEQENKNNHQTEETDKPEQKESSEVSAETSVPVTYIVKRGDTLIGICLQTYGNDAMLSEICELNHISDPDDIKEGEKILLPQ